MAVDYFQPDTLAQSNGMLTGMNTGQQLFAQGMQNAYLPQNLAQQLQRLKLTNAAQGIQNQYLPQSLQAQIGLQNAQAGLAGAQTQFFPVTAQAQWLRGAGDYYRALGQNAPVNVIASLQNNPGYQSLVANNPELAKQISNIMVQGSLYGRGATIPGGIQIPGIQQPGMQQGGAPQVGGQIPVTQNVPRGTTPGPAGVPLTPQQQKTLAALQQNMQQNGQQMGNFGQQQPQQQAQVPGQVSGQTPGQIPQNPLLGPQDYQNFGSALASRAIEATTPKSIQQQRYFAQSFDTQMAPWIPKLPDITNFAGAAGKANLAADKYAAAFNLKNSPQYQNWDAFVNSASELAGNELRRALGVNASVSAKEDMDELQDTGYWNEHPADALARWNALLSAKHANDQVLTMNQSQALGAVQKSAQGQPFQYATQQGTSAQVAPGQYQIITKGGKARVISDADLAYTAKQNNTSIQAVKQRLGIQ